MAASTDTILDFNRAEGDRISLSLIDANSKTAPDEVFKFIGTEAFHKVAGELRYAATASGVQIYGDIDGDGVADLSIIAAGVSSLVASDFFL